MTDNETTNNELSEPHRNSAARDRVLIAVGVIAALGTLLEVTFDIMDKSCGFFFEKTCAQVLNAATKESGLPDDGDARQARQDGDPADNAANGTGNNSGDSSGDDQGNAAGPAAGTVGDMANPIQQVTVVSIDHSGATPPVTAQAYVIQNAYSRSGYSLTVNDRFTINTSNHDDSAQVCIARISDATTGAIRSVTFAAGVPEQVDNYSFILDRVGRGGSLNRLGCFYTVIKTGTAP